MPAFAIQEVKLTDKITVQVGTEITCTSLKSPRYTRGVIKSAYINQAGKPTILIEYGPFCEPRQIDDNGKPVQLMSEMGNPGD